MKKAILLVIDGVIKIVFGTTVKNIKLEDVWKPENVEFLGKLFSDFEVQTFEGMSVLTKEEFDLSLEEFASSSGAVSVPQPAVVPTAKPVAKRQAAVMVQPAPTARKKDDGLWFRSEALTTIILDDVLTDQVTTRPGAPDRDGRPTVVEIRQPAIIPAGRAINLKRFDPEQLKKSRCLSMLLKNGDVVRCTEDEARMLEKRHAEREVNLRGFGGVSGAFIDEGDGPRSKADDIELGRPGGEDTEAVDIDFSNEIMRMGSESEREPETIEDILKGT